MAVLSSSISSLTSPEEDFCCPICWDIFQTPVTVSECHHIFCRKCFLTAIKIAGPLCPVCRGPINGKERTFPRRSAEKEEAMRKHVTKCKSCGKLKKYSLLRRHYKACWQYQEKIGNKMDKVKSKKKKKSRSNRCQVNELPPEQPQQLDNVDVTQHGT